MKLKNSYTFTPLSSRKGGETVIVENPEGVEFALHSRFSPLREAERFVDTVIREQGLKPNDTILLLGEGVGYITLAFLEKIPSLKVIPLFLDRNLKKSALSLEGKVIASYFWEESTLSSFLDRVLKEESLSGLKLVKWQSGMAPFEKRCEKLELELKEILTLKKGSLVTTMAFSPLWIKNSFKNFLAPLPLLKPFINQDNWLILSSGATLEKTLPYLKELKKKVRLLALPSSLRSLEVLKVKPDLIIATDPGYWAEYHLRYQKEVPLLLPFTANSRKIERKRDIKNSYLFSQESFIEKEFFNLGIKAPQILAEGTVSTSAYNFLKSIGANSIYFAGLDLAVKNRKEHVSPHTFDELPSLSSSRFKTVLSWIYYYDKERYGKPLNKKWQRGEALEAYATRFNQKKIDAYRLFPSPVKLSSLKESSLESLFSLPDVKGDFFLEEEKLPLKRRKGLVKKLLDSWEGEIEKTDLPFYLVPKLWAPYRKGNLSFDVVREESEKFITNLRRRYGI